MKEGTFILRYADANLSDKEIPVNTFFYEIVMVRDRIRVVEQKINSSKKLEDQCKIDLKRYTTRNYGSLTTFNVLFQLKSDHFIGEGSK
ncbi:MULTISPECIES: hypothetical protein [unclassified Polaribacter]|uniref:hypothetical protein n=1 Tax=unclassified Polaribacter TaxID=196858 RepID=UPI002938D67F|nr:MULTISPECIES: hypothetical protein [unclassified Polaribacter]